MAKPRKLSAYLEQCIAISLLSVPEFREKAGLLPRTRGIGDTCATIAAVSGLSRQRVNFIEQRALLKIRAAWNRHPQPVTKNS